MADDTPSTPFDQDFDAIQAAVLETARGRWFLAEFARRNRVAETDKLLGAIQRLERTGEEDTGPVTPPPAPRPAAAPPSALLADLKSLLESVAATHAAVQAVEPAELGELVAPDAKGFDRVVDSPDDAHATLLAAAEQIQETVWMLREQGAAPRLCDELDRRATQVFAACAYGEVAARRTAALVQAFAALVEQASTIAGRHRVSVAPTPARPQPATRKRRPAPVPPPAPSLPPDPSRDADLVFSVPEVARTAEPPVSPRAAARLPDAAARLAEAAARPPTPAPAPAPQPLARLQPAPARPARPFAHLPDSPPLPASDRPRRPTTLADIDALTAREKLRLFT